MTRLTHTAPLASTQRIMARPGEVEADRLLPQVERRMTAARPQAPGAIPDHLPDARAGQRVAGLPLLSRFTARPDRQTRYPWWWGAGSGLKVLLSCTACGEHVDLPIGLLVGSCSEAQRFMAQHPRWTNEPEAFLECEGRPAVRIRLAVVTGAARLTLLVHPQTLQVLRAFME